MPMLTNEKINEIRNSVDIVDVISSYVSLTPRGKNYFGICPFHDDNNPSMSVSKEKQIYTCFSCGATGNVFKFIQDYENVDFIEAVKIIADKGNIELNLKSPLKVTNKYNNLYEMYNISKKLYQNNLNTKDGEKAKKYLLDRKIDEETIKKFEIGYAVKNNSLLFNIFKKKNYSLKDMLDSGLINQNKNTYNDVYYNRIIFPLYNLQGQVVAYSGRIYETEDTSKYINTKETPIFKKGELLYNYFRAKEAVKKQKKVIIVEGFMDVIRLSTIGLDNVVASMGTAITKEHALLLRKLSSNIVLCFDGDNAGLKATLACMDELEKLGIKPTIIRLKEDLDPDEYILKYGKDSFLSLLDNPVDMLDFKLEHLKNNRNLNNSTELSDYVNDVIKEINKIDDDILKKVALNKISKETGLEVAFLEGKIKTVKKVKEVKKKTVKYNKYQKAESYLIYYMLKSTDVINQYEKKITYMPDTKYRFLAREIDAFYHSYGIINVADLISYLSNDDLIKTIGEILSLNLDENFTTEQINDYIETIREYNVNDLCEKLTNQMKEETDSLKKASLAQKIIDLKKRDENYD